MTPEISIEDFSFRYRKGTDWALSGINLEVKKGELLGVMGRSGAGKSTLAAAIGAFVPHLIRGETRGRIIIDGMDTIKNPPRDFAGVVGEVFQDFESQIFSSRADIEVAMGPENLGLSRKEIMRRVKKSLQFVSLQDKAFRVPSTLSGGEKQRLAIASILAMEPQIYVFDEPTTDLDPLGRKEVTTSMDNLLKDRSKTAVIIDHDTENLSAAEKIAVLNSGRLVAFGPPHEIFLDSDLMRKYRLKSPPQAEIFSALGIDDVPLDGKDVLNVLQKREIEFDTEKIKDISKKEKGEVSSYGGDIVEMEYVSFSYNQNPIFSNLNLKIREREFVALVGPNGGGKTTLAKHINGLLLPETGKVKIAGETPDSYGARNLSELVGFVHQNPDRMIFAERVFDEAAFGLNIRGENPDKIREKVFEMLKIVGLEDKAYHDPFLLTKGERQRLAVASTLTVGPQILIMDEPTTGLDYGEIIDMMELLKSLNKRGHTVIFITHSMDVVAKYARRMIILNRGEIVEDGTVRDVFSHEDSLSQSGLLAPLEVRMGLAFGFPTVTSGEFINMIKGN